MKNSILLCLLCFLSFGLYGQTCSTAPIYANDSTNAVCWETVSNVRNVYSNNIPDHTDDYSSPFTLAGDDYEYSMCRYPMPDTAFTSLYEEVETAVGCTYTYRFGIEMNGVKFDPNSAETFTDTAGEANINWHKEASYMFAANMGSNGGHLNPFGEYHYHETPIPYYSTDLGIDGTSHSPIVGYAADGFPIYYKYVYSDPYDSGSPITGLASGYSLKSGTRPGDGLTAPDGAYTGLYIEDYAYSATDLDECNGRFGVTPDFPGGTYYYVLTDNWPHIPRCFKGTYLDNTFRVGPGPSCPSSMAGANCATTATVYGCMDPFACNYDAAATADLGNCSYASSTESMDIIASDTLVCEGTSVTLTATGLDTYSWTGGVSNGVPFTPAPGMNTYIVSGEDTATCLSDEDTIRVIVKPTFSMSESATVCRGDDFTYPDGFTESNITSATSHISTLATVGGCDSTITTSVSVTTVDTSVSGSGGTLTATLGGASYQWVNCDSGFTPIGGASSQSFTTTATGNYAVILTSAGCTDTSGCHFVTLVNQEDGNGLDMVRLFPNPTNGQVILSGIPFHSQVIVRDILGKELVQKRTGGQKDLQLELPAASGLYFVRVLHSNGIRDFKVVKN